MILGIMIGCILTLLSEILAYCVFNTKVKTRITLRPSQKDQDSDYRYRPEYKAHFLSKWRPIASRTNWVNYEYYEVISSVFTTREAAEAALKEFLELYKK